MTGRTSGTGIEFANGAGADFNTMEYMDVQGPGAITYTSDGRGIDATPFPSATGNTFSHMAIFDWESAIYAAGIKASVFEYLDVYDIHAANWSTFHPNGLYTSGAPDSIVRYSNFHVTSMCSPTRACLLTGRNAHAVGVGIIAEWSGGYPGYQGTVTGLLVAFHAHQRRHVLGGEFGYDRIEVRAVEDLGDVALAVLARKLRARPLADSPPVVLAVLQLAQLGGGSQLLVVAVLDVSVSQRGLQPR